MRGHRAAAAILAMIVPGAGAMLQAQDAMQFADGNGDGKITPAEFRAFSATAWGYFTSEAEKVKVADLSPEAKGALKGAAPDADGILTKAAFVASSDARFKAADKDGDGVLTAAELSAWMAPF